MQMNVRIRISTKEALEKSAEADLRSISDQTDVLICEALEARAKAKGGRSK